MQNSDIYLNEIWNNTLKKVDETKQVNEDVFEMYFNGSRLQSIDKDNAIVVVPFFINLTVMQQYRSLIEKCLEEVVGNHTPITILEAKDLPDIISPQPPITNQFITQTLDDNHTFSNFVVGRSNAQAHAAANTCAQNPGYIYNPLFIYGDSGIGKTHLLNAIGNEIKMNFPNKKIGFITGADFVDDVYFAAKTKQYDELKAAFKELDLLLFDDIQFIADKPKTHEIFFSIFNHLVNNKKQICVTSDRPPEEIKGLEDRLITRFNQGLTVNISAPEYETAVNILRMKINDYFEISQEIDDDVINYIATNCSQNVRLLEGALKRLSFYTTFTESDKDRITLKIATEAFKDQFQVPKNTVTFSKIKKTVGEYYGLSISQIEGKNRTKNIVNARHIAIYLCRKLLDEPYENIGYEFGKRDHATVMNSCERVESLIKSDPLYLQVVGELEKKLVC